MSSNNLDLEARKKRLEQLRAERQAKERHVAELVEAKAPPARAASPELASAASTATGTTAPSAAAAPAAALSATGGGAGGAAVIVGGLAEVDIPPTLPPPKESYERASLTDHVFVYREARPHPDEVAALRREASAAVGAESDGAAPAGADNDSFAEMDLGSTINVMDATRFSHFKKMAAGASAKITHSQQFTDFLRNAGLVLSETLRTSSLKTLEAARGFEEDLGVAVELVTLRGTLFTPLVKDKVVTGIAYQPGSSEFFCASYASHEAVANNFEEGTEGVVLLWSTRRSHTHPVFVFSCQDEISTVAFSSVHPHLLIGGTFTGRVVLWDQRETAKPVVTSFPTADTHSMTVFRAQVIGRDSTHALITASAEGRICTWPVDKPKYPMLSISVAASGSRKGRVANALAIEEHEGAGASKLHVGGADGTLYEGTLAATASREALDIRVVAKAHQAAITSLDVHPLKSDSRFAGLTISASMDWTCRLWRGGSTVLLDNFADFVYDVKWSPTNPTVFAACDGSGNVTVWNLAHSMDGPAATVALAGSDSSVGNSINRIAWNDAGDHIIAGGSQGECYVLGVHHTLVAASVTDVDRFAEVLNNTLSPFAGA